MGCEPGDVRLLSVARLCDETLEEKSFKFEINVKERIDMTLKIMYDMVRILNNKKRVSKRNSLSQ